MHSRFRLFPYLSPAGLGLALLVFAPSTALYCEEAGHGATVEIGDAAGGRGISGEPQDGSGQPEPSAPPAIRTTRVPARPLPGPRSRPRVYLTGRVAIEGGEPTPVDTLIERVCHGQVVIEGHVNSKGEFSIVLGQNSQLFADASAGASRSAAGFPGESPLDLRQLAACEIRAYLPGYRSTAISLGTRRSSSDPEIGTIMLTRLEHVEGLTISATTLAAPKGARKACDRGMEQLRKANFGEALLQFEKALAAYHGYAVAHYGRGQALEGLGKLDDAVASYRLALEQDAKYILPYLRLAAIAAEMSQWGVAEDFSARAIKLNPIDFPFAYYLHSLASLELQQFEKAEKSAREAKKMDPGNRLSRLDYLLAVCLANRQQYDEAAKYMRSYIRSQPSDMDPAALQEQLSRIEQMAEATSAVPSRP